MPNISYIVQKQQGSPVVAFCTLLLPADLDAQPPARASHSYSYIWSQAPGIALIGQIWKKRSNHPKRAGIPTAPKKRSVAAGFYYHLAAIAGK
jgi:hypothetical protein